VRRNHCAAAAFDIQLSNGYAAMNANNPETWVIAAVLVVALIAGAFLITREQKRRQSRRLQERFGPEYGRVVAEHGDRTKAESELKARENRVERLTIVALAPADAAKFGQAWSALQGRFIDNPKGVVMDADRLVRDLMVKRGYPMGDFERRAADISVDHPALVETYRSAQIIALRDQRGEASTEELRKAVVYYRTLFDELLEVRTARQPTERDTVVHS
jgi:hypothetical protein